MTRKFLQQNKNKVLIRIGVTYMAVAILFSGLPISIFAQSALSADIKINGSNGPVTITNGQTWNYSWVSNGATACQITTPSGVSGITLAGNDGPINPDHPWYPAVGGSTTLTFSCTDGTNTVTDSATIHVVAVGGDGDTPPPSSEVTADIKINGSNGPVTITNGETWNYSWSSNGATACQLTSPTGTSGITLAGNDGPINPDHPWYPAVGGSTTLTFSCTDGTTSATDSATIHVVDATTTPPPAAGAVTADIKINGSDGPVVITNGQSWNYSWTSNGATACQLTSPTGISGITLAGNDGPINPDHPWYPAVGGSTTLTLSCTNGTNTATDSAIISVVAVTTTPPPAAGAVTADIKINGSDGPVTIINGQSWNYSWTSTGATACQLTSPTGTSGITLAGNDGPINPDHPWYPAVGGSTTLTLNCTNGTNTATDAATIHVIAPTSGGGGGATAHVSAGSVTGQAPVFVGNFCPYLTTFMRIDFNNDRMQVIRLQAFLKTIEGHNFVNITGVFDEATRQAVSAFQLKYSADILAPWGINQPTGYVYITTLRKINEILCGPQPAVTVPQAREIRDFVPPKEGAPIQVGKKEGGAITKEGGKEIGFSTTTTSGIPVIGETTTTKGQNSAGGLATALFATPQDFAGLMQCLYEFLLILIVLYIIGSVLENVLYKNVPENVRKRFFTKWATISVGLAAATVGAYLLGRWCLILPLLVSLFASVAWMFLYPKHPVIKSSAKTWYQTSSTKASSLWSEPKDATRGNEPPKEAVAGDSGAKK